MLAGYLFGYGYCPPPYGPAYRRALRTTRTRLRTLGHVHKHVVAEVRAGERELAGWQCPEHVGHVHLLQA